MRIAVLGAGNGGCAIAGDMAYRGLDVTLVKTSRAVHDDNFNYLLENGGVITLLDFGEDGCMSPTVDNQRIKKGRLSSLTRDLSIVKDMDVILIYVQTGYHESLIASISQYLRDGQIIIINPGYFSTAFILKYCSNIDLTVVEAQSSFIDCRITEPGTVKVSFRNVRNPVGIYPVANKSRALPLLNALGFPFHFLSNVVEAALHNPNLIVHPVGAVMSIPMIDTLESKFCMYHSAFTKHVWNVLEKLDEEKMNVLERVGCARIPYVEACKFRNSLDESIDAKQVFFDYASMPTAVMGPSAVDSRYITEDIPQGLVMLESLGFFYGVKTPTATALIDIASASLKTDFRAVGRTVNRLGYDNIKMILSDAQMN